MQQFKATVISSATIHSLEGEPKVEGGEQVRKGAELNRGDNRNEHRDEDGEASWDELDADLDESSQLRADGREEGPADGNITLYKNNELGAYCDDGLR